jgi:hypothetical protein
MVLVTCSDCPVLCSRKVRESLSAAEHTSTSSSELAFALAYFMPNVHLATSKYNAFTRLGREVHVHYPILLHIKLCCSLQYNVGTCIQGLDIQTVTNRVSGLGTETYITVSRIYKKRKVHMDLRIYATRSFFVEKYDWVYMKVRNKFSVRMGLEQDVDSRSCKSL